MTEEKNKNTTEEISANYCEVNCDERELERCSV